MAKRFNDGEEFRIAFKRSVNITRFLSVAGIVLALLGGCGSGDSGVEPAAAAAPISKALTGRFVDGPVAGLRYTTPSLQGETNAAGEFQYRPGETVSFFVGDILVGQAAGAATITPFDLAGATPPESDADVQQALLQMRNLPQATPLEVAANIAAFLQTLDEDGDPGNGITIPPAMHSIATGASVDFKKSMYIFPRTLAMHKLIAAGRAAGLWGGLRPIRSSSLALDSLYASLGLSMTAYVKAIREVDSNADGAPESREIYSFDARGDVTEDAQDNNADGVVDSRLNWIYDANGHQKTLTVDNYADGTIDISLNFSYDANGNLIKLETDKDGDGIVDARQTWSYDANDYMVEEELDGNVDGTVDSRVNYAYDANGNQALVEFDSNADGIMDKRTTTMYNINSDQTSIERDDNGDGIVDYRAITSYDAAGYKTMTEVDNNGDGTVDERVTYGYDSAGNQTLVEDDTNADGTVDYRESHSFDAAGRRTKFAADTNGDGRIDYRKTWSYAGNQMTVSVDSNADGIADSRFIYTFSPIHSWRTGQFAYSISSEWPSQNPVGSERY